MGSGHSMKEANAAHAPLTGEQRRLVQENIGLVHVHLRRNVRDLVVPRRDREWEDLFQEGCLGLIQAAERYRQEDGIPFAAFALPRIHNAVSRALRCSFATVYVPPRRTRPHSAANEDISTGTDRADPIVYSLSEQMEQRLCDRRHPMGDDSDVDTIGERLRDKYEHAVRTACDVIRRRSPGRGDRAELLRILTEERFLVPQEESRRPLRQIARDTRSSYARVAQCGQQLSEAIRDVLDADPEFRHLRWRARVEPDGPAVPIDAGIERELVEAGALELVRRYREEEDPAGAGVFHAVMKASRANIEQMIRDGFAACPTFLQRKLLEETRQSVRSKGRADPTQRPPRPGKRGGRRGFRAG